MKQIITILVVTLITTFQAIAQGGAAINTTGATSDPSAILDIQSDTLNYPQGILIPRMSTAKRNAIVNPALGLQIFNTTTMCFEYFAYGIWQTWHCAICPMPGAAGTITGTASVCQGNNSVSYSVPAITNATSYIWGYTGSGVTINGNSNSVTLDFSGSATSGDLTVYGTNQCGNGGAANYSITVNYIPSAPVAGSHVPSKTQIVWNWNSVPGATGYKYNTVNDYASATNNGTNTSYTQTGLTCNTAYTLYVWAYGSCGNSVSATLNQTTLACFICGTENLTDSRDNNVYTTVLIGSQCWMKENLRYLPYVSDPGSGSATVEYYYVYGYSGGDVATAKATSNYSTYGVLYNWPAVMSGASSSSSNPSGVQGICPTGWHMPSDAEWIALTDHLSANSQYWCGSNSTQTAKSLTATINWNTSSNTCAVGNNLNNNNSSGFTALPGGYRHAGGAFLDLGNAGLWWSATASGSNAWLRFMLNNSAAVGQNTNDEGSGLAVRCVKN